MGTESDRKAEGRRRSLQETDMAGRISRPIPGRSRVMGMAKRNNDDGAIPGADFLESDHIHHVCRLRFCIWDVIFLFL